ncbi:metal-sensing transcriptional repressor [Gluconobacter morbifer]|uniref:Copper-sensing transcriptional repressor CsoR n=1 Tax=Gluconobacter morbifer G707 TaxID=1088869 RepID=G6XFC3_9PROT|nr:metal-sensing transcriptional repressor [Gluconobacter morbifer]EHH68881.1 hypothetical protein GMO_01880 [Gluconobacter morbifer G707]
MAHHYPEIEKRLRQACGHLAGILAMMEDRQDCQQLVQQLQAVEGSIHKAKRLLIEEHVGHCILESLSHGDMDSEEAREKIASLVKYL